MVAGTIQSEDAELPVGHTQNAARMRGRDTGRPGNFRRAEELKSRAFLQNKEFLFVENTSLKG